MVVKQSSCLRMGWTQPANEPPMRLTLRMLRNSMLSFIQSSTTLRETLTMAVSVTRVAVRSTSGVRSLVAYLGAAAGWEEVDEAAEVIHHPVAAAEEAGLIIQLEVSTFASWPKVAAEGLTRPTHYKTCRPVSAM